MKLGLKYGFVACHADREFVFTRHFLKDSKQLRRRIEHVHVGIEMRRREAHGLGPFDLRSNFDLYFIELRMLRNVAAVRIEIAVRSDKAGNQRTRSNRVPSGRFATPPLK